jgi:hypothetical protein
MDEKMQRGFGSGNPVSDHCHRSEKIVEAMRRPGKTSSIPDIIIPQPKMSSGFFARIKNRDNCLQINVFLATGNSGQGTFLLSVLGKNRMLPAKVSDT